MPRHRRIALSLIAALALAATALALSACGSSNESKEVVEGEPVELGELQYNVVFSRFLNPHDNEDSAYLVGQREAPPGSAYFGVFLEVQNESEEPQTLADLGALAGRVAPSVLVNAHLMWRGTAIELLEASGAGADVVEQVRIVLADRCDAGLMAVSRQFDEPRDRVTGLANRTMLLERVAHALQGAGRYGDAVGLIYIDPDLGDDAPGTAHALDLGAGLAGDHVRPP